MRPAIAQPRKNEIWLYAKLALTSLMDRIELVWKGNQKQLDAQILCLFIGYPRSGHSLVSSLLDAHPQAIIAHRLDLVKYVAIGYSMRELGYLVLRNSQRFAGTGRELTAYKYTVPDSWQGRYVDLKVIGDQEGRLTAERLADNPTLIEQLQKLGIQVRFIHVIRNPYDNIASWSIRAHMSVARGVQRYFDLCKAVEAVKACLPVEVVMDVRHEDMLVDIEGYLTQICSFLDLEVSDGYLHSCSQVAYQAPHRTRNLVHWTSQLCGVVREGIERFDFLHGYTYDV